MNVCDSWPSTSEWTKHFCRAVKIAVEWLRHVRFRTCLPLAILWRLFKAIVEPADPHEAGVSSKRPLSKQDRKLNGFCHFSLIFLNTAVILSCIKIIASVHVEMVVKCHIVCVSEDVIPVFAIKHITVMEDKSCLWSI